MAKHFSCKLVTPTAQLLNRDAEYASIPAWDGLMGIQPGRAPLVARLGAGEFTVRILDDDGRPTERAFFVNHGFAKMAGGELTIIAEEAVAAESINETDQAEALKSAEAESIPEDSKGRDERRARIHAAKTKVKLAKASKAKGI